MKLVLLLLLIWISPVFGEEGCWEDPWVDTPEINMPKLIEDGYSIASHSMSLPTSVAPNQPMIMVSVYLLKKENIHQQLCASTGILERETTCKELTEETFPIYLCTEGYVRIFNLKDKKTKSIHRCYTLREASKMRTASCKPETKTN